MFRRYILLNFISLQEQDQMRPSLKYCGSEQGKEYIYPEDKRNPAKAA